MGENMTDRYPHIAFCVALMFPATVLAANILGADLTCNVGPVAKTYGGTKWFVWGCHNDTDLVIVSAGNNPAMPFVFRLNRTADAVTVRGEGAGDKAASDAAYAELAKLPATDVAALFSETKAADQNH